MSDIKNYQMLINGDWVDSSDGGTFDSVNPTTGEIWSRIPEATEADVNLAVETAHLAFTKGPWSKLTPTERGKCLRKLGDLLAEKSEGLGRTESIDTGKMLKETRWQAKYIADFFHFFAGCADKVNGETLPIDKPDMFVFTKREPLGVVAAVVPWNSQLFLVAVKLGPALAAGNTVVLKASEHASAAMLDFGKLIEEAGIQDIADEFLEKITALTRQIVIGDPLAEETQMGPLCTISQLENIQREVAYAQEQGGKILVGGKQPEGMGGLFYEPTIIECPRQDLRIVDTELFGPVLSVQRFKTEEEVLELANDSELGLAAGIFTQNAARSLRMANAVRAGIVWVNTYRVVSPIAEFGGVKGSGHGRESGFQAIYDYTRPKTIWMNTSDEPMANPFVMR